MTMRVRLSISSLCLLAVGLAGCKGRTTTTPQPLATEVATAVVGNMDRAADPCVDFYRYACGGWLDATELPADKARYGRFHVLAERNQKIQRDILQAAAQAGSHDPGRAKLGAFWSACMDEGAVEAAGTTPLAAELALIDGVADPAGFMLAVGKLHRRGVKVLFDLDVEPDYGRPDTNIAFVGQGGLGLPDAKYYLESAPRFDELRGAYAKHVARMLELAGAPADSAKAQAEAVIAFETRLARAALPREQMREPEARYHMVGKDELAKDALGWPAYFDAIGRPDVAAASLAPPVYFAALPAILADTPPETLRAYLRWQLVHAHADDLPSGFVDENFAFFGKTLRGQAAVTPRWERCVLATDKAMGELLGQDFVAKEFSPTSRERAVTMIREIEHAFDRGLPQLAWMDDATRTAARGKIEAIANKIGYPERWRDYDALQVGTGHLANVLAAESFEFGRRAAKIDRPVDRGEWYMSPPTVNAYYNPSGNEMVIPAGILQPPFFDEAWPMTMNFGGIGMVMGHELTHGFDDQGRKFDGEGKLRMWWAPEVGTRFEDRAACVDELYSGYEVQPGVHLSGKLTLGENIADFGGIKAAHGAFHAWAEEHHLDPRSAAADGLTHEQLFFVSFGQIWCTKSTPENDAAMALVDPHSHPRYRVNGPLANFDAFAEAFACESGEPMRPTNTCEVW